MGKDAMKKIRLDELDNEELIGDHQGGKCSPGPGHGFANEWVGYFLLPSGAFAVVIDNTYGSDQGYDEVHGGDKVEFEDEDLETVIELAKDYCELLYDDDNADTKKILRAHLTASQHARTWLRRHEIVAGEKANEKQTSQQPASKNVSS